MYMDLTPRIYLALFPGLPHFLFFGLHSVNTRKQKSALPLPCIILNANQRTTKTTTKTGEAWEKGLNILDHISCQLTTHPKILLCINLCIHVCIGKPENYIHVTCTVYHTCNDCMCELHLMTINISNILHEPIF